MPTQLLQAGEAEDIWAAVTLGAVAEAMAPQQPGNAVATRKASGCSGASSRRLTRPFYARANLKDRDVCVVTAWTKSRQGLRRVLKRWRRVQENCDAPVTLYGNFTWTYKCICGMAVCDVYILDTRRAWECTSVSAHRFHPAAWGAGHVGAGLSVCKHSRVDPVEWTPRL